MTTQPTTTLKNKRLQYLKTAGRWLLLIFLLAAAALPSLLVMAENWFFDIPLRDSLRDLWCKVDFLCRTMLPSYFIYVYISLGAMLLIFLIFVPRAKDNLFNKPVTQVEAVSYKPAKFIFWLNYLLTGVVVFIVVWTFIGGAESGRLPGVEYAAVILCFLIIKLLQNAPPSIYWDRFRKSIPAFLPVGLGQLAMMFFLSCAFWNGRPLFLAIVLLCAALVYMFINRRRFSVIWWIVLAALLLYGLDMKNWQYAVIGDDLGFYSYAKDYVLHQPDWQFFNTHLFSGQGMYASHPYFSSVIQAVSMWVWGEDGFGWRISSMYLTALSLPFFYYFFKGFVRERMALLAAGLLGLGHYVIMFSKIGYNNLQALFGLGLVFWLAGEAVKRRTRFAYTLLGAALGLCLYLYPASFYVLPPAGLFLLFYDFPRERSAWKRWLALVICFFLVVMPLMFQPAYWLEKIPGTFLNKPELVENNGILTHLGTNFLYSLSGHFYIPQETHFVVSSYVDPLTAVFFSLGAVWLLKTSRRQKFACYWMLSFLMMLFLVGATHDRLFPSTTRMFMLLPWYALCAVFGLVWLRETLAGLGAKRKFLAGVIGILLAGIFVLNLIQAYPIMRLRTTGSWGIETMFIRLVQRDEAAGRQAGRTYLFITDPNWVIDGIRTLREVYGLPYSPAQLERLALEAPQLNEEAAARILADNTFVIVEPFLDDNWRNKLDNSLLSLGLNSCAVRDTLNSPIVFTFYYSPALENACPKDGVW